MWLSFPGAIRRGIVLKYWDSSPLEPRICLYLTSDAYQVSSRPQWICLFGWTKWASCFSKHLQFANVGLRTRREKSKLKMQGCMVWVWILVILYWAWAFGPKSGNRGGEWRNPRAFPCLSAKALQTLTVTDGSSSLQLSKDEGKCLLEKAPFSQSNKYLRARQPWHLSPDHRRSSSATQTSSPSTPAP